MALQARAPARPYRADIDGLRAIAVTAVLVFHAFPEVLPGGFLGVDMFFVISGYLITGLIQDAVAAGGLWVAAFYARRIRRIVPALLLVLTASFVAGWFMLLPLEYRRLGENVTGGALFFANLQFVLQSVYFDRTAQTKPLLHLWSLSVEEQFYLVWPFVMMWAAAVRARMLPIALAIAVASFAADVVVIDLYSPSAAFYLPFTRFWELMLGAAVCALGTRAAIRSGRAASVLAAGCLVIIAASIAVRIALQTDGSTPPWWNLLPVLATAGLMATGAGTWAARALLGVKPMVWLGKISYPLYLWHWPLLSFLAIGTLSQSSVAARIAALAAALVLAQLTYVFVERPIRFGPHPRRWVPRLAAGLLAVAALGAIDYGAAGFPARIPQPLRRYVVVNDDYKAETRAMVCSLPELIPAGAYAPACYRPRRPGERSIFVWGDSFAARLYTGLAATYEPAVNVRQMTRDQCVPLLGRSQFPTCNDSNAIVIEKIAQYPPDVVVVFAAWTEYGSYEPGSSLAASVLTTIARLRAVGVKHIVFAGPSPLWHAYLPTLLARHWRAAPAAGIPAVMNDGLAMSIFAADRNLRELVARAGAGYVSLTDRLCSLAGCRTLTPTDPPELMTADVGHFTKPAALYVVPFLSLRTLLR
jgi:peptidoglycan/LPS O-acetylase OafA/YrhL